jgi:crossover junction endodeoxyribonuclease RuvC
MDGQINGAELAQRIQQIKPGYAMIELVSSMPKQGVASTFKFGRAFGTVLGVLAATGTPYHFVGPGRWKKHFRLSADKEQARALAVRLWPEAAGQFSLKKHHGRAEAALIARYAAETQP